MKPLGSSPVGNSACDSNPDSPECTKALSTTGLHNAAPIVVVKVIELLMMLMVLTHEKVVEQERAGKGKQHPISSYKPKSRGGNNDSRSMNEHPPPSIPTPKPQLPKEEPKKEEPKEEPKKEEPKEEAERRRAERRRRRNSRKEKRRRSEKRKILKLYS